MNDNERILVFTACYNEKENIEKLIKKINEVLPEASILIIDDNSPDLTKENN
jgi:dolichol-phosphate mannosyltransferase